MTDANDTAARAANTTRLVHRATALLATLLDYAGLPPLQGLQLTVSDAVDPAMARERFDLAPGEPYDLQTAYNVAAWARTLEHPVTIRRGAGCEVYFTWALRGSDARVHTYLHQWDGEALVDLIARLSPTAVPAGEWPSWEFDPAVVAGALAEHPAVTVLAPPAVAPR